MDIYLPGGQSWTKRFERFFRYVFLISSAIFAALIILALIFKGETPQILEPVAVFMLVTWLVSFGIWMVFLIVNSRLASWAKGLFNQTNSRKKKIGLIFLLVWFLLLILFILGAVLTHFVSIWQGIASIIVFLVLLILLPVWGFLLGNKLVKIITLTIPILILLFFLVYLFILRPHKISGSGMQPNFMGGEYVFSELLSYGFGNPKRGDVIIFTRVDVPVDEFIARVIGLPGEYISIKFGRVYINNKLLDEAYVPAGVTTKPGPFIDSENVFIPSGEYVVMNDNRSNSSDSRHYGFIKKTAIHGRVFYVYWPPDRAGLVKLEQKYSEQIGNNNAAESARLANKPVSGPTSAPIIPLASCQTLGTKMVRGADGKGQIGCDVTVGGDVDLSKSYCESRVTHFKQLLIPDAFGRPNRYFATLTGLNFNEGVRIFVYSPSGANLECLPELNK